MGCLVWDPALFQIYLEVGRELNLPTAIARNVLDQPNFAEHAGMITENDLVMDRKLTLYPEHYAAGTDQYYLGLLDTLGAGLNVLYLHLAHDGTESAAMAGGVEPWGNRWRQLDVNAVTSTAFRRRLTERGIKVVTWREVWRRWLAR